MAFEIIKSIVAAEEEADAIKQKALGEADAIRTEAKKKADEILSEAKKKAKSDEIKLIDDAITNSQGEVKKILGEAEKKCKEINTSGQKRWDKAVEAVIGKVVGKDGNS